MRLQISILMCLQKPSKALINNYRLAKQEKNWNCITSFTKAHASKNYTAWASKAFLYSNGCMKATSVTIFHQRFSTKIIHTNRAQRASIYTKNQAPGAFNETEITLSVTEWSRAKDGWQLELISSWGGEAGATSHETSPRLPWRCRNATCMAIIEIVWPTSKAIMPRIQ